jgi:P4 family phage/plasmid primase-like protien
MATKANHPAAVAARMREGKHYLTDDTDTLYSYNPDVGFWQPLSKAAERRLVLEADGAFKSSGDRRKEILDQLRAATYVAALKWGQVADDEVACADGVVSVSTGEPRPHRPEDYLEQVLPHPYRLGAKCPSWLAALELWFGPGEGRGGEIRALQEFFGYVVLSHAKFKKALVLKGPGDTGKSVVVFVLQHLVGSQNCCSLPVDKMDDEQARSVLVGARLNILSELPADAMIADGGFKQLVSTQEPVFVNQKYKAPMMYVPSAKHAIATNNFPRVNDRMAEVLNRLLIIPMLRVLTAEEKDETLQTRLLDELPGILLWAIEGAKRLVAQRGQFSEVPAGTAMLAELRADVNPVREFLRECCEPADPDFNGRYPAIRLSVLADRFNRWNKGQKRITPKGIGRLLRSADQVTRDVRFGKAVAKSLIGWRLLEERAPSSVLVAGDAFGSAENATLDGHEDRQAAPAEPPGAQAGDPGPA